MDTITRATLFRLTPIGLALAVSMGVGCSNRQMGASYYATTPQIGARSPSAVVFVEGQGVVTGTDLDCGPGDGSDGGERCSSARATREHLVAKAASGWRFDHWEVGHVTHSEQIAHVEVADGGDGPLYSYVAVFAPMPANVASAK